ncbi:hypothetical protein BWZ20_00560 [Winogradskyella sp. J14-2]|uniref:hypothetical protein n=1 Tax=Winogradskyella sp. J14-2 TaxID=1936080 RepID=UPI000972A547|nr:hypothetical protein [Winogradskyella sp. J14-2]APY06878.1 hypothetical protein BWZ20_00560 [Winogradskyella sp. J14-2]
MKKLLYIIIIPAFIGCTSVKNAQSNYDLAQIKNNNLKLFNGIYQNKCEKCEAEICSLWSTIDYKSEKLEDWADLNVKLEVNDDFNLKAQLFRDNKIIDTQILEGKIANNYFQLKRQWKTDFKFIILWTLGDSSVKLAMNKEKELVVLRESGGVALLVAFPVFGADSPMIETKYKRAK